ncbi:hypothetical protein KZO58_05775 [Prevotella histicola]|jgi:hypothetical protein|nr:hypothetical protein [Prevotella histicola]
MLKMTANKNKKGLGGKGNYNLGIPKPLYPKEQASIPIIINILVREAKTTKEG